jgi:hypothetical protein
MNKGYRWLLIGPEHPRRPQSEMETMMVSGEQETHLFARGQESIRITVHPATMTLHVFGPGRLQKMHEFTNAAELVEFLQSYEEGVLQNGWRLLDVDDRRLASRS